MKPLHMCALTALLACFAPAQVLAQQTVPQKIAAIAEGSECATIRWNDRGRAPRAYVRGMALMFADAACHPDREDVRIVAAARGLPGSAADRTDALTWYDGEFSRLGMANTQDGLDTLRHAYTLLIGLGMRESSGAYCVGRDSGANFSTAASAEAGLFQTSWGVSRASPALPRLYETYSTSDDGCRLDVFRAGVSCSAWDARNWGQPTETGFKWQVLTKGCPAFATEYAAVVLRTSGGSRGEFGPIRTRATQVIPACDAMLQEVQDLVAADPHACDAL